MVGTKEAKCVVCGDTDIENFLVNIHKSLCKEHLGIKKTKEIRKAILKPYDCIYCHESNQEKYHIYCKKRCKKHYNKRSIPKEKKKKVKIVVINRI